MCRYRGETLQPPEKAGEQKLEADRFAQELPAPLSSLWKLTEWKVCKFYYEKFLCIRAFL